MIYLLHSLYDLLCSISGYFFINDLWYLMCYYGARGGAGYRLLMEFNLSHQK